MKYEVDLDPMQDKILADEYSDIAAFIQLSIENIVTAKADRKARSKERAMKDDPNVETMPASDEGMLKAYFGEKDYLDAKGRKAAAEAEALRRRKDAEAEAARQKKAAATEAKRQKDAAAAETARQRAAAKEISGT